jgi:hypothetical protein
MLHLVRRRYCVDGGCEFRTVDNPPPQYEQYRTLWYREFFLFVRNFVQGYNYIVSFEIFLVL